MIIVKTYRREYRIEHDSAMILHLGTWLERNESGKLAPGALRFYFKVEEVNGGLNNSTYDFVDNSNSVVVIDPLDKQILYTKEYIHKDTIDLLLQIQYDIVDNSRKKDLMKLNDSMHEVLCNWEIISRRNKKIETVLT